MESFYIPKVLPYISEEHIKNICEQNGIGPISHIDRVERYNNNDKSNCYMAYVHFKETKFDIPAKTKFIKQVLGKVCKLWYNDNQYWICLPDTSTLKPEDPYTIKENEDNLRFIKTIDHDNEPIPEWLNEPIPVELMNL
jgi:hypothetical protein